MTRTFVALEMNTALQRHLAGVIQQVAQALPSIRWVMPASIHLTLAFLGELTDSELAGVKHAVAATAQHAQPFAYRLTRPGSFGPPRQPRVIWMGIEEASGTLKHLHDTLNKELTLRNFAVENRQFSPHFTLARIKTPLLPEELQRLQTILAEPPQSLLSSEDYDVRYIAIMKSDLSRAGAHYTSLQAYQLGK